MPTETMPRLFTPFSLAGVTFPNRIVLSPMCQYEAVNGHVQPWHLAHHARFALSGVGGAVLEATGISPEGRITPGCLGIWEDGQIAGLAGIVALYHGQGIPVGIQIGHAGRKASTARPWDGAAPLGPEGPEPAWQTVAPSALPHLPNWPVPQALDKAGIAGVIADFVSAGKRALAAGFDFVEIHGAHGYLLHTFFSPLSNHRTDQWGGSLENRMRLPVAVATALREALPAAMPIIYRISAVDPDPAGITTEDSVALAAALKTAGVSLMDVSSGGIVSGSVRLSLPQEPGFQVPLANRLREGAHIPTMAVGLIITPEQAEEIVAEGRADLIAFGRELLADPAFAYRAAQVLGHPAPETVLPRNFAFYLERRAPLLAHLDSENGHYTRTNVRNGG